MPLKKISYRRCRRKDLLPAIRLIMMAFNDLRRRTGKTAMTRRVRAVPLMFLHLFDRDSESFACAWDGDRLVGFAGAINRGRQWYLAWLFVHPRYQDRGIGRRLLEKIWRTGRGVVHSLSTFTYNMQAVGIYSHFGILPEALISQMRIPLDKLTPPVPTGLTIERTIRRADLAWIDGLERAIRGHARRPELEYWCASQSHHAYLFKRRGRRIGYSFLVNMGELGPAGGITHREQLNVLRESLRIGRADLLSAGKAKSMSLFCPTENRDLYAELLAMGFRNDELLLYMTDEPYANLQCYLPATLALF